MTTEISPRQNAAADFLANHFDSVVVSSPNAHGNVSLTALYGDIETMRWLVRPDGRVIYTAGVGDEGHKTDILSEYVRKLREGTL
jgi:hypothetical protein